MTAPEMIMLLALLRYGDCLPVFWIKPSSGHDALPLCIIIVFLAGIHAS